MQSHKNILIFTSRTGGGHVSLAEAVQDLLIENIQTDDKGNAQHPLYTITIVDPQPPLFHFHYRMVSRHALWLWATEFRLLDTQERALLAHRVFTALVSRQLHTVLADTQPDLIITTYPFFSYEVMQVLKKSPSLSTVPLVSLFSDANGVHAAWLTERGAAATLAPTRETYKQVLAAGFAPERVHLVGWPVRTQFAHAFLPNGETRDKLLTQLHLVPDRFTIFLQGGSEGAAHIDRVIKSVQAVNVLTRKVQIILAAGTNRALQERYRNTPGLAVLPHTKEIAAWMAASDVIMGKAGPNMLFESVTLGKPFIATSYIPGQELANLTLLQHYGLGWIALHSQEQQALLTSLLHNPDQLSAMSATINAYRSWNSEANTHIAPLIRSLLDRPIR